MINESWFPFYHRVCYQQLSGFKPEPVGNAMKCDIVVSVIGNLVTVAMQ